MKLSGRGAFKVLAIFSAVLATVYVLLFALSGSDFFRQWAQTQLSRRTGMDVRFAELALSPPLQLVAVTPEISKPGVFSFRSARLRLSLTPFDLWSGTLHRLTAEEPILSIDVVELMKPAEPSTRGIGLRNLKVQNGSLVLKRKEETLFELPHIDLEAQNLNIGEESGIRLRADAPWLDDAETEMHFRGAMSAMTTEIIVRPKAGAKRLLSKGTEQQRDWLQVRARLEAPQDRAPKGTLVGRLEKFPIGTGMISGDINASASMDDDWRKLLFNSQIAIRSIAESLGSRGTGVASGGADIDLSGSFSLLDKALFTSAIVKSPFGKGRGEASASFSGAASIQRANFSLSDIPLPAIQPFLPRTPGDWKLEGLGKIAAQMQGRFEALEIEGVASSDSTGVKSPEIGIDNATIAVPFLWSKGVVQIKDAKITAEKIGYLRLNRWQAAAERTALTASTELSDGAPIEIAGSVEMNGAKFISPDRKNIGENLTARGPLKIAWLANQRIARVVAALTGESGEILWDKFFLELKTTRPRISFDGDYFAGEARLDCRRGSITMAEIGTVELAGSVDRLNQSPEYSLQVRSSHFMPGNFFATLLRENLKRRYPSLDSLSIAGAMAFHARLKGSAQQLSVSGNLSLSGGELRPKNGGWEIGGLDLKLPFSIGWDGTNKEQGGAPEGSLAIGRIRLAGRDVRFSPAVVALSQNELRFREPLRASAFGGEIIVTDLRWQDVIRQPRQLNFSLAVNRVQLEELTEAMDWPAFSGTLTGSIPEVQSSDTKLKTQGEIRAEVFGGRVRISKPEIDDPFSSLAAIRLDAALANISLEQLSKTFAFGRISGILEGTVADLIITDGQPSQFGADLHSVDRGTEQRISVEALNKITVLSSGQSAGALYGGLAGLFDSFRYSKLGFKAILRNDRLVLRGVESRGDQEYLVVGSLLPPTVNVISHTQTIGFSELLRRLERIRADQPKVE